MSSPALVPFTCRLARRSMRETGHRTRPTTPVPTRARLVDEERGVRAEREGASLVHPDADEHQLLPAIPPGLLHRFLHRLGTVCARERRHRAPRPRSSATRRHLDPHAGDVHPRGGSRESLRADGTPLQASSHRGAGPGSAAGGRAARAVSEATDAVLVRLGLPLAAELSPSILARSPSLLEVEEPGAEDRRKRNAPVPKRR